MQFCCVLLIDTNGEGWNHSSAPAESQSPGQTTIRRPFHHVGGLPGLPAGVTNSPAAVLAPPAIVVVPDAVVEYPPEEPRVEHGPSTTTKIVGLDDLDDSSFLNWLMMPTPDECSRESSRN